MFLSCNQVRNEQYKEYRKYTNTKHVQNTLGQGNKGPFLKVHELEKKYGEIQGINVLEILKNYWEGGLQSTENIY